jgi:hypothetical protein
MPLAMLHEITHNLGAVQHSAPHSTGSGHCTDGFDVMCRPRPGSCAVERYDCNKDDYFNPSGPIFGMDGTRMWNVADSVFTCRYDNSFSERACALRPRLFVATRDNGLWARDAVLSNVDWQLIGHANNVVAMAAADGKLFAITRDNGLWARDTVLWDVNWRLIGSGPPNNAVAMAAAPGFLSDKLFAATSDNKLWVRDSFSIFSNLGNGGWQLIGHANNIAAMAADPGLFGKLFAATRDNGLWARDPVLSDVNWQLIGHANNVAAMAATDGKLFAAARDNGLWARDRVLSDVNWQLIGHANNVAAMSPAPRG